MANKVSIDPRYLSYDTPEVEALLGKVENPDTTPTAESGNLITSGGVKTALDKKYEAKSTIFGASARRTFRNSAFSETPVYIVANTTCKNT